MIFRYLRADDAFRLLARKAAYCSRCMVRLNRNRTVFHFQTMVDEESLLLTLPAFSCTTKPHKNTLKRLDKRARGLKLS